MAMAAHVGSFNTGTGTTDVAVTAPGFTPKAIIFWWSGRTEGTDTIGGQNAQFGMGFATGTTARRSISLQSEDGQAASDSDRAIRDDSCISTITTTRTLDGAGDLKSLDANGFTIAIDDAFARDLRVSYLALGGDDITNAATGTFTMPAVTGNQDISGVGFQPDFVMFLATGNDAVPEYAANACAIMGAASGGSAANNGVLMCFARTNQATMNTGGYSITNECVQDVDSRDGDPIDKAQLTLFQSDGFRLNWTTAPASDEQCFYLALKGGNYLVGELSTRTDTNDIAETSFGFQPDAAMFFSHAKAESTTTVADDHAEVSIGAFSATDERSAQGYFDEDAAADSNVITAIEHDACYVHIKSDATIDGLMDVKSIDSDGFTMVMDDADPAAAFVWYVAFGSAGGSTVTKELSDTSVLAENQTRDFWGDRLQADPFTLSENLDPLRHLIRLQSDSSTFTDLLTYQRLLMRLLSNTVTFSDQQLRDFYGDRTLQESIALTDSLVRSGWSDRLLQELLSFSDQHAVDRWLVRLNQESIAIAEQIARDGIFTRDLQDVFTFAEDLVESVTSAGGQLIQKTLSDTFVLADNMLVDRIMDRVQSDAFTFLDQTVRIGIFDRLQSDAIPTVENFLTDTLLDRSLQESIVLAENLLWDEVLVRQISDEFSLTDQIVRDLIVDRVLADTFTFVGNLVPSSAEADVVEFVHWRLYTYHKWALRRRLWRRYMDLDIYPPQ
jgi:hypothetical protein